MSEEQAKKNTRYVGFYRIIRECVAMAIWLCLFIKFVLFDFDVYLVEDKLPQLSWLVRYRFIITMGLLATLWLVLGSKRFKSVILYIIAYPFILFFWKLPKLLFKNWPIALVFFLAFGDIVKSFKRDFILVSFALVAGLIMLIVNNTYLLSASMIYLGIILLLHLFHKTKKAYGASIFEGLAGHVRLFRTKIEKGDVIELGVSSDQKVDREEITIEQLDQQGLSNAYMFNQAFEYLATELNKLSKSRKVDLYLILSLVYTFVLTAIIFSLIYYGLYKIDPSSFQQGTLNIWRFAGFSFGVLTGSDFSSVTPVASLAKFLCYFEVGCRLLILVMLVFTILTAARERYKEDVNDFVLELKNASKSTELLINQACKKTISDVEVFLIETEKKAIVGWMRHLRGLPKIQSDDLDQDDKQKIETETQNKELD